MVTDTVSGPDMNFEKTMRLKNQVFSDFRRFGFSLKLKEKEI